MLISLIFSALSFKRTALACSDATTLKMIALARINRIRIKKICVLIELKKEKKRFIPTPPANQSNLLSQL